jgi:hypothetical protein
MHDKFRTDVWFEDQRLEKPEQYLPRKTVNWCECEFHSEGREATGITSKEKVGERDTVRKSDS